MCKSLDWICREAKPASRYVTDQIRRPSYGAEAYLERTGASGQACGHVPHFRLSPA